MLVLCIENKFRHDCNSLFTLDSRASYTFTLKITLNILLDLCHYGNFSSVTDKKAVFIGVKRIYHESF